MKRIFYYQPKTLKQAFIPTNFLYWIVGMGVLEYPIGQPRRIFGLIYTSTICITYTIASSSCYPTLVQGVRYAGSSVGSLGFSIYASLIFILTFIIILLSTAAYKRRNDCLRELMNIDEAIRTMMNDDCSYGTIFMGQIRQLIGPISFLIFSVALSYIRLSQLSDILGKMTAMSIWYYLEFSVCLATSGDMTFCTIIRIMTQYFKALNSLLRSMRRNTPDECDTRMGNLIQVHAVIADKQRLERLCRIRTIHSRLVRVANLWTEIYTVHIISTVIVSVCTLTFAAQGICGFIFTSEHQLQNYLDLIHHSNSMCLSLGKLYIIISAATELTSEAKRTCTILLEHLHPIAFIRFEVHEFSLQLIQNPLRLSAGGLFDLDHSLLQMVIAAVSTYLIVLIQTRST